MLFTHLGSTDIPDRLVTDEFILRPIMAADVALDYAAVMASKEYLRPWEQTGWPADDFTVEDDLADVEMLEQRHAERRAFTYTLMNPDESDCLGCVYILPPDARHYADARITPVDANEWQSYRALVSFWVRTSRLSDGLDERLLDALRAWLARDANLGRHLFVTNEQVAQQVGLFERSNLQLRFRITKPTHAGTYLAYE
ncbi:GNAT family N-acetyltransferase [Leifsonia sp. RAF41]|uniref:GNAT family N-acetyltransferase n=1 Tax=Leifsonia sp. RAF41 TaxID=3233056 RepID=UPI003F943F10